MAAIAISHINRIFPFRQAAICHHLTSRLFHSISRPQLRCSCSFASCRKCCTCICIESCFGAIFLVASSADYASGKCALSFPFRLTSLLIFNAYAGDLVMQCIMLHSLDRMCMMKLTKKKYQVSPSPKQSEIKTLYSL